MRCGQWPAVAALALVAASCGGGAGGSSSAPCGAPPGNWQYISSCDTTFGGIIHQCQDTYGTPAAVQALNIELPQVCSAGSGTLLTSPCPLANSLGSCLIVAATGTAGELARLYQYAQGSLTPQSFQQTCVSEHGTYLQPDGTLPDGGTAGSSASCAGGGGGSPSTGGVAFSVATMLNGQVLECTNFVGSVTSQQLQSVLAIGATASACPAANAGCACAQPAGSGTFGTTATLVYYKTASDPTASICAGMGTQCTSYTPP